jgi:glycosyltransferase involved in cell wall biosynthesis
MLSVVVLTYEWPEALDVVLRALSEQTDAEFEIVVADDGSGPRTAATVESWRAACFGDRLRHAWQPDSGFRRARVSNLGALAASGDHLVFIDGDSLPRLDFVRTIGGALLPGWFLAGKRISLDAALSRSVLDDRLPVWRWSALTWLLRAPQAVRRPGLLVPLRDRRRPWRPDQSEFVPPYNGYGFLFAISREDFENANGFDMRFTGWGQEDEDIAARLRHMGLRCGWAGPRSTLIHLWHQPRTDRARPNQVILDDTRATRRERAADGLEELSRGRGTRR